MEFSIQWAQNKGTESLKCEKDKILPELFCCHFLKKKTVTELLIRFQKCDLRQ